MLKVMLQQMMVNLNLSRLVLHRQSARHLVALGIEKHHPSAELFITFSSTIDETLLVRKSYFHSPVEMWRSNGGIMAFQVRQETSSKTLLIYEGHEGPALDLFVFCWKQYDFSNKKPKANGEIHQQNNKRHQKTRNLHLPTPPTVSIPNPPILFLHLSPSSTSHHTDPSPLSFPTSRKSKVGTLGPAASPRLMVQKSHSQPPVWMWCCKPW